MLRKLFAKNYLKFNDNQIRDFFMKKNFRTKIKNIENGLYTYCKYTFFLYYFIKKINLNYVNNIHFLKKSQY